jgi:hypothetical protein
MLRSILIVCARLSSESWNPPDLPRSSFQRKLESILILLWCASSSAAAGGHTRLPARLSPVSSPSAGADPPFLTPGILPSALRAAFGVRAAPAAQCLSKARWAKERTPRGRALRASGNCSCIALPRASMPSPALRVREAGPGFSTVRPCTGENARASCARPYGLFRPSLTAPEGPQEERRTSLCAEARLAFASAESPRHPSPSSRRKPGSILIWLLLLRAGSARSWGPCAAARRRRKARRVARPLPASCLQRHSHIHVQRRKRASFSSVHGCLITHKTQPKLRAGKGAGASGRRHRRGAA